MDDHISEDNLVEDARDTEQQLESRHVTEHYLEHARSVRAFDQALRARGAPIKASYRDAGLDYLLARKATWIEALLDAHGKDHERLWTKGPSILLFACEAERRLTREGRLTQLPLLLRHLEDGLPRDGVREKYFSSDPSRVAELIGSLRRGRVERARRIYEALAIEERQHVDRLAHAIARLVEPLERETRSESASPAVPALAAESIDDAVVALLEVGS